MVDRFRHDPIVQIPQVGQAIVDRSRWLIAKVARWLSWVLISAWCVHGSVSESTNGTTRVAQWIERLTSDQ